MGGQLNGLTAKVAGQPLEILPRKIGDCSVPIKNASADEQQGFFVSGRCEILIPAVTGTDCRKKAPEKVSGWIVVGGSPSRDLRGF